MSQHPAQLLLGDGDPLSVGAVDHHDDKLLRQQRGRQSPREDMSPYRLPLSFNDQPAEPPTADAYLRVGVVRVPRGPQGLLAPDVPHQEVGVVDHDLLHVAPDGGRGVHHLVH